MTTASPALDAAGRVILQTSAWLEDHGRRIRSIAGSSMGALESHPHHDAYLASHAFTPACSPTARYSRISFGQWSNTVVGT